MNNHNLLDFCSLLISLCWLLMYGWLHRQQNFSLKDAKFGGFIWILASILISVLQYFTSIVTTTLPDNLVPILIPGLILLSTFGRISQVGKIPFLLLWIIFIYLPVSIIIRFYVLEMNSRNLYWPILNGVAGFSALAIVIFTSPLSEFRQIKPSTPLNFLLPATISAILILVMPNHSRALFVLPVLANALLAFWHYSIRKVSPILPAAMTAFLLILFPLQSDILEIVLILFLTAILSLSLLRLHPMHVDTGFWVCAIHGSAGYSASILNLLVSPLAVKFTLFLVVHAAFAWSLMISYMLLSLIKRALQARF